MANWLPGSSKNSRHWHWARMTKRSTEQVLSAAQSTVFGDESPICCASCSRGTCATACSVSLILGDPRFQLGGFRHEGAVEISPCASSAREATSASARSWRAHRISKPLDRFPDDRREVCRSDDLRRENSELAFAFDSRAEFAVFLLKSLDAVEQLAGSSCL